MIANAMDKVGAVEEEAGRDLATLLKANQLPVYVGGSRAAVAYTWRATSGCVRCNS